MARSADAKSNGEVVGERLQRQLSSGDAPREPQMTGFRALSSLRRAVESGRQIDPLGRTLEFVSQNWQPRQYGRDQRAIAAMKTIRDLDPQAAQAVWNFLRLANPGLTLQAMVGTAGLDEEQEEGPAQAYLDQLMTRVAAEYGGGGDQLHNVLTLALITSGAVAAEVAPTSDVADVEDWYPIEPVLIAFRRERTTHELVMGQRFRDGTFVEVNTEQVFYVPLDPDVEDPYGRPPMLPALSAVFQKTQMLNDVRAAAHAAGFPRIDVQVVYEAMVSHAPAELQGAERAADLVGWAERQLTTLIKEYESMQVDDTFVHYDWVKISPLAAGASFDFGRLDEILTRQVNSSLKTLPVLLGVDQAGQEGYGSVQWNIQLAAVQALQRIVKRLIEKLANVSLQLAGFQAHARVEYANLRATDRLTESQAETFEYANLKTAVQMGWRDNEEASDIAVGHQPVGEPMDSAFGTQPSPAEGTGTEEYPSTVDLTSDQTKTGKTPTKPKQPGDAAWDLLRQPIAIRPRTRAIDAEQVPPAPADDPRGRDILEMHVATVRAQVEAGAPIRPVVEAMLLSYRRDLSHLLRDMVSPGVARSIWEQHRTEIDRLAADFADALGAGLEEPGDVIAWLEANVDRESALAARLVWSGLAVSESPEPSAPPPEPVALPVPDLEDQPAPEPTPDAMADALTALARATETLAGRPIDATTTVAEGAVQVAVEAPSTAGRVVKRETRFQTDDQGRIVGKEEVETWR